MNPKVLLFFILFGFVLFTLFCTSGRDEIPFEKPNVLFIIADDYDYHSLCSQGSDYYETPNLNRLASESMIFTNGYAANRVCSPSMASIMSGKSPARKGITDWIGARTGEE